MPRALSTALRARIKADLAAGHDIKTIMSTHAISDKKARAMKKLYDNCGEVWLPRKKGAVRTGRPPKITPDHEARLRLYLADRPDAYIKDMCRFLEGACGTLVDESTMWRTVRRLGWQAQRVVKPRDERGFWVQTLPRDESGSVVTNAQKRAPAKRSLQQRGGGGGGGGGAADAAQAPSRAMVRQLLGRTRDFVRAHMAQAHFDVAHDYGHVQRVLALSMEILRVEQKKFKHIKFDETITELVALMHDIDDPKCRPPTDPQLPTIETHLLTLGWPPHIAIPVSIISASVSYTTETQHPAIHLSALRRFPELAIVQDADRLEALGAIGIGRTFAYGGARGRGLAETVGHVAEKLVRLEGMMKTGEGRRLARVRSERVEMFRGWMGEEMGAAGVGEGGGEMGEGGEGANGDGGGEDPGRRFMETGEGGGNSGDGSSSESDSS